VTYWKSKLIRFIARLIGVPIDIRPEYYIRKSHGWENRAVQASAKDDTA
jgi:hypothetical protein